LAKKSNSVFKGIRFSDLLKDAVLLDGSKWENLPFAEKIAMHYTPLASPVESAG
jgi:hypothetical protein